jgi:hypothetical protein
MDRNDLDKEIKNKLVHVYGSYYTIPYSFMLFVVLKYLSILVRNVFTIPPQMHSIIF